MGAPTVWMVTALAVIQVVGLAVFTVSILLDIRAMDKQSDLMERLTRINREVSRTLERQIAPPTTHQSHPLRSPSDKQA